VRHGWLIEEAGFDEESFTAIIANDSFCFTWNPSNTLKTFHRLLTPGGILAMRLTNKRLVMGVARALSKPGSVRDARISKILKTQFHSIDIGAFKSILTTVGFNNIEVQPHALTAPWSVLGYQTRAAYMSAAILYYVSFKTVNLSPGILLFAQKDIAVTPNPQVARSQKKRECAHRRQSL
jgi:SAM-dependent methyltransferase